MTYSAYEHDGFLLITEADYGVSYDQRRGWVRSKSIYDMPATPLVVTRACAVCGLPLGDEGRDMRVKAHKGACRQELHNARFRRFYHKHRPA